MRKGKREGFIRFERREEKPVYWKRLMSEREKEEEREGQLHHLRVTKGKKEGARRRCQPATAGRKGRRGKERKGREARSGEKKRRGERKRH